MRSVFLMGLAALFVLPGCRRLVSSDPDSGQDAGRVDAAPMDGGMDGGTDDAAVDAAAYDGASMQVQPVVEALERASTVVSLMLGPLVADARTLEEMGGAADNDTTIRQRIRNGVATNSIVDQASCVDFNWNLRRVVITFTDCVSENTGLTINGRVALQVRLAPVRLEITLMGLAINDITFSGDLSLRVGRAGGSLSFLANADLTWTTAMATQHVVLDDIAVAIDLSTLAITFNGDFTLDAFGIDTSGRLIDILWQLPDCHPSAGRARFELEAVTTIVTFLPVTPTEGIVQVQLPPFPPFRMMALQACEPYMPPDGGSADAGPDASGMDGSIDAGPPDAG